MAVGHPSWRRKNTAPGTSRLGRQGGREGRWYVCVLEREREKRGVEGKEEETRVRTPLTKLCAHQVPITATRMGTPISANKLLCGKMILFPCWTDVISKK